jgi:predicted dehydrogenase
MTDQLVEHQMKFVVVDVQRERAQDPAGLHQARALSDIAAALSLPDIDAVAHLHPQR